MSYEPNAWQLARDTRRDRSTRWILLTGIILVVGIATALVLIPGIVKESGGLFMPAWVIILVGAGRSPFTLNTFLTRRGFDSFDEFERVAIYEALRRSYLIIMIALAAAYLYLLGAADLDLPLPTTSRGWQITGIALFWIVMALPVTVAEFTVPMPDPDDDA